MQRDQAEALCGKICSYLRQEYAKQRILLPDSMEAGVMKVIAQHIGAQWDRGIRELTVHRK